MQRRIPNLKTSWAASLPLVSFLLLEIALFGYAFRQAQITVRPSAAGVALIMVAVGMAPVFLKSSAETKLSALFSLLLAGLIFVPADNIAILPQRLPTGRPLFSVPLYINLRLIFGIAILPVGFHYLAIFPPRSPQVARQTPSAKIRLAAYLITAILAAALLLLPQSPIRLTAAILTAALGIGSIIWSIRQLILISLDPHPDYRHAARQARLLLLGFLLAQLPLLLRLPLLFLAQINIPFDLVLATQLALPAIYAFAILRHDLYKIDKTVRRALATSLVYATLLSLYLTVTLLLTRYFFQNAQQFSRLAVLICIIAASAALVPLYRLLQRLVNRFFYPERALFRQAIDQLHASLSQVTTQPDIVNLLDTHFPQAINSWAKVTLGVEPNTLGPTRTAVSWHTPLQGGDGSHLGHFWLGQRQNGIPFSAEEKSALVAVTNQASLALAYAAALADLNQLNQSLEQQVIVRSGQLLEAQRKSAAFEERQRLARDLHDSVTQTLFSLGLNLRLLRVKSERETATITTTGLREQETTAKQALAEMRALLTHLRAPLNAPTAAPQDFCAALRHHCELIRPLGLQTELEIPDQLWVSAETAKQLLFVAREGLHNVVKHSGVDKAWVELSAETNRITLSIIDLGRGMTPNDPLALQTIRERITMLNGQVEITAPQNGGTRLQITIPHRRNDP